MSDTLHLELPAEPVDGFELTYFSISTDRVQEIRLKYHSNTKWSDVGVGHGANFVDQWQVFTDGYFSGRFEGWAIPTTLIHQYHFAERKDAVDALKRELEQRAQQADERAREYREQASQVE